MFALTFRRQKKQPSLEGCEDIQNGIMQGAREITAQGSEGSSVYTHGRQPDCIQGGVEVRENSFCTSEYKHTEGILKEKRLLGNVDYACEGESCQSENKHAEGVTRSGAGQSGWPTPGEAKIWGRCDAGLNGLMAGGEEAQRP